MQKNTNLGSFSMESYWNGKISIDEDLYFVLKEACMWKNGQVLKIMYVEA